MSRMQELADRIMSLTVRELVELNKILRDMGGPGFSRGMREPRRPGPRPPRELSAEAEALIREDIS